MSRKNEFRSTTRESVDEDAPEKVKDEAGEAESKEAVIQEETDKGGGGLAAAEEDTNKFAERGVSKRMRA